MNVSEYIFVFISFVLALAVSELARGVGRILKPQSDFRVDGRFVLWVLLLFLYMVQFWWGSWAWIQIETWPVLAFVALILGVVLLYLAAYISFSVEPGHQEGSPYDAISRRVWTLLTLFFISGAISWRLMGLRDFTLDLLLIMQAVVTAIAIILAVTTKRWVHWAGLIVLLYLNISYLLNSPNIG